MRTLVAGWFSFEQMGATAGDLLVKDVACRWLAEAGHEVDVALARPFTGGVDWRTVDPHDYATVVFACGPFGNGDPVTELLDRFEHCRLVGLDVSMLEPLAVWNPFDVLVERDSSRRATPDLAFASGGPRVPVVGVVLVHRQSEYVRSLHHVAEQAIDRLLASREVALVRIDTRLDVPNAVGLRTPGEVESLIARMDAVVTTRLHGMVLALKHGVPALAIDPIGGGAKICAQIDAIGWPAGFTADELDDARLSETLDWCLGSDARERARACRERVMVVLEERRLEFHEAMLSGAAPAGATARPP
ncbi:MAG: polysaccharide pyruvyl transferase family protein [Solirubrobacterales bacterium]|nr:polysaccharide pyruvyl transferase family protein [Solirubrobacterales bacterium]